MKLGTTVSMRDDPESFARHAASSFLLGSMTRRSCETSLPSISPKPPGSRKSRCRSMSRSGATSTKAMLVCSGRFIGAATARTRMERILSSSIFINVP